MRRLILVSDAAPPQINGVVRTLQATSSHLERRGWVVSRVSPSDYRTIPMPGYSEIRIALPPYRMNEVFRGTFAAVHIATEGPLGLAARRYCIRHGIPFTTAYHTQFPPYLKKHWKVPESFTYAALRRFHGAATRVMAPTPTMCRTLEAKGFTNVMLWGRGVDTALFNTDAPKDDFIQRLRPPVWLNVGRLSPEKNLDAFLRIPLPGTKVVIGDGPDAQRLQAAFPSAIFLGAKVGLDLVKAYRAADYFVFPSRTDTFGLVMAEAISCGVPVAAYPVTGPIDVVKHGQTGFLHPDLFEACLGVMGVARRSSVRDDFSWERATDQFEAGLVLV